MEEQVEQVYQCFNYRMSRAQRDTEISRGQKTFGTSGYENAGCYKCDGQNKQCHGYLVIGALSKINSNSGSR